jgi:DNA modification methylase
LSGLDGEGDVVFDPMCGSGTTCKMALKNSRFYIGCDISKEYVELTKKRLQMLNTFNLNKPILKI